MLLTRLPLRIATAFDLHVLGLPPAFVLSQDQTLKLNENLVPAGHYLYDESQAHLPANHRFANLVNLSYVTARVSHRPQTLYGYIMNTVRKDSAVHVSLSSYLIVKQQSLAKQQPSDQSEKSD